MLIGSLLTRYFLEDGITQTAEWQALTAADLDAFESEVRGLLHPLTPRTSRNEANTERELIWPVLEALGWHDISVQQSAGRFDVPDIALFPSPEAKAAAEASDSAGPYAHAVAIAESKRWMRPLDRADTMDSGRREGPPSSQINRYLTVLQGPSNHRLHWGLLTNGRLWRLYYVMARSRSEDFLELDLPAILGLEGFADDMFAPKPEQRRHWLAVFYLLFRRQAFPAAADRRDCFLVRAVDEGQNWEARVADSLRALVFDEVFPNLVAAIADHDPLRPRGAIPPAFCGEVREGALVLLYRLLFLLYAEDRNLLPVADPKYDDYGLRRQIRNAVAERLDKGDVFAERLDNLYGHVRSLSLGIDQGEPSLGLPPYNGGLFDALETPILGRVQIPDRKFAPIIDALSRMRKDGRPHRINFQDLSVRQLGSIYEGLLEFGVEPVDGRVRVIRDEEARHGSGSYYTPDPIVDLIVERVAQPPIEARLQAFREKADRLAAGRRPVAERLAALREVDPASAILSLKFCDPAMGSGHFLVALVDYLADRILEAIAEAESGVPWLPEDRPYVSPLTEAIDAVRSRILDQARTYGWRVTAAQLDDRLLVRRMILKRCIYGVDKNPMAVELAKVSLWLHTFTIGAPLSFLDHHLRCGDSILGDRVRTVADWLQQHGALHISRYVQSAKNTAQLMIDIERMVDADITEVKRSAETFSGIEEATAPLRAFFDVCKALRGLDFEAQAREQGLKGEERRRFVGLRRAALQNFLDGTYGDPVRIAAGQGTPNGRVTAAGPQAGRPVDGPNASPGRNGNHKRRLAATDFDDAEVFATFGAVLAEGRALVAQHRFLHWEIVFPGIWSNWESREPAGGFDGVLGNPPYLRQERLSAMKAELQRSYESYHGAADLYVYFFERGLGLLAPGAHLSFVVTNKWLRAGYGAPLREFLATRGWIDAVIDFGHARQIFTQADVFPSVVVMRRPQPPPAPEPSTTRIVVIPREQLRLDEIPEQVEESGFDLPRASFGGTAWRLDPPEVQRLMDKIRSRGVPLKDYAGVKPYRGILTGLNEAFLIDTPTKDRLCAADPASAEIIRPYLRGQDIKRWVPEWAGLWMIALKSSENHPWPWADSGDQAEAMFQQTFPALHAHMKTQEKKLQVRQDHGRFWWELRSCSYYDIFSTPKIIYQEIQFHPAFCLDRSGLISNNKTFILESSDQYVVSCVNSPLLWWYNWRVLPHMKDEALSPVAFIMENLPIPQLNSEAFENTGRQCDEITMNINKFREGKNDLFAWLKHEHGIEKPSTRLREPAALDEDGFVREVRKARKGGLTPAGVRAVLSAYRETVGPLQRLKGEIAVLERRLSRLVEDAYGLTEEERALMWRTAPPRMPIAPPPEYAALTPDDAE